MSEVGATQSEEDFQDTPDDWCRRWAIEMEASEAFLKRYWEQGEKCLKRYLDEREGIDDATRKSTRWNIYTRNVQTQRSMMYGKIPTTEVSRKWADANDDRARLAGEIQERTLECDAERDSTVWGECLDDLLTPSVCIDRVRYVAEFEEDEAPAGDEGEKESPENAGPMQRKVPGTEDVLVDYINWKDFRYSPCRIWSENRWVAFPAEMSRTQLMKRFKDSMAKLYPGSDGEALVRAIPLNAKRTERADRQVTLDGRKNDPWQRAEVWEIWDKETKRVFWWVRGFDKLLDMLNDPYRLKSFFPCPRPVFRNKTNSKCVAKPDFELAKDLYNEIDTVSTRITIIERAIRVAGLYDATAGDIGRLVKEGGQNELIPSKNWKLTAERGGLRGMIDWLPLDQMVQALDKLREYRTELIAAADQITGMTDIMRGDSAEPGVTATEQSIRSRFASVRMRALQDEFARFISETQRLKAELQAKFFEPETYLAKSNAEQTFDNTPEELMAAVQLLKSRFADYRIEVKSDSVALEDFAALRAERTELMAGLGSFMTSVAPLIQQFPGGAPFFGDLLKWAIAGTRGSRGIEGRLDKAIALAEQQAQAGPPPQQPDPKVQAQQLKMQGDQQRAQLDAQKESAKLQGDLVRIQAETQAKDAQEASQARWNVAEAKGKRAVTQAAPLPAFGPGGAGGVA